MSPPTNIATRSPNASTIAAAVAGIGTASGTNTIARRPPAMHAATASTATATSSSGAGRTTNAPDPTIERRREGVAVAVRRGERENDVGRGSTAARCAVGAAAILGLLTDATRGGTARPITAASGATYRSLTHRNSASMSSSKNRTGDTTFFTLSIRVGERLRGPEHPSPDQPPVERHLHERAHAGTELGRKGVRERPIEAEERAVDADRDRAFESTLARVDVANAVVGRLTDGAAEVVGAVGRLPGELLAPEVPVRGGLAIDRTGEVEVADDRGRPEVEHLPDGRQ